ncbi:4-amino-4-deoxychorismate lyase [Nocardioides marmoriginsengisoli]|uniref:4-amino-4-deoxychorismate lyase n=1 Tax=Nocardioides marmoriginsengisoli TaxID=661483 RepID=A0A3N0CL46_9ACTN|nr:aminotransferase class IV [Nocardioides marmoriginsengisoli]RNL64160.1 4-amino-4-deoxychorismate lyase [Nocardioides marmoriginsengisoli]
MRVWFNGSVLNDPAEAAIRVDDHGLTVGDGVFEAVKIVNGQPFALTRHLDRLTGSAAGLGLPAPDLDEIRTAIKAVTAGQDLALGRLRVTWTAGPAPMGSGRGGGPPSLVVVAAPMVPAEASTVAVRVPWVRNERSPVAGLKTTSYAENVVALAYARERGATEAIFGNTLGNVCEGTGSNLCYVIDGEARTPTLASGCLAGVTRALVLQWCGVVEVDEPMSVLDDADELFLVSTTRDVQAIRRLDDRELPSPGPVTAAAMAAWAAGEAQGIDP